MKKVLTILAAVLLTATVWSQNTIKDVLLNNSFTWNDNGKYLGTISFSADGFAHPSWSNLIHKWQLIENDFLLVSANGTQYVAKLKYNKDANIFYGGRDVTSKVQDGAFTVIKIDEKLSKIILNNTVFTWKDNGKYLGTISFSADGFAHPSWSNITHKWQLTEDDHVLLVLANGNQYVSRLRWNNVTQCFEGNRDKTSKIQDGVYTIMTKLYETTNNLNDYMLNNGRVILKGIYFNSGGFEIIPESKETLKEISEYLNKNPEKHFYIVGHTDNIGDFIENKELSEKRAKAVMDELVSNYNVNKEQLISFGVSSLSPIATNKTEEGRAKNRRVEIVEQ